MKRVAVVGVDAGDKAHGLNLANVTISPEEKTLARRLIERRFRHDEGAMAEILQACDLAI